MNSLLKNVSIYFVGNVINRIMGFVVMLVATHFLSRDDTGLFSTLNNVIIIILTIASAQIWMAIIRFIFDYESIKNKFKIISTGYFLQLVGFSIYSIVFAILSFLGIIQNYAIELYIMSFGYVFNQNVQFACRGLEKNKLYVISGIVGSMSQLICFIVLLFVFKLTCNALIIAISCSYLAQGMFIEFFLKSIKHVKLCYIDFHTIKKMLKYCVPTTFNFISYWFNQSANSVVLTIGLGTAATGVFSTAYKMNSLIGLFVMSFNFAFQEFSFNIYRNKLKNKIYNQTFNYFIRFISCSILILMPLTLLLFSFAVGPKYVEAKLLIPLLYLGSVFDSIQNFLGSIMQAEKKVNFMFISQLIGSIITLAVLISTVKLLNTQCVGVSMICCFLTVCIFRLVALKPKINLKFNLLYLSHFIPMYALTVFIYLNYSLNFNLMFLALILVYSIFCTFDIIKDIYEKICKKLHQKNYKKKFYKHKF